MNLDLKFDLVIRLKHRYHSKFEKLEEIVPYMLSLIPTQPPKWGNHLKLIYESEERMNDAYATATLCCARAIKVLRIDREEYPELAKMIVEKFYPNENLGVAVLWERITNTYQQINE